MRLNSKNQGPGAIFNSFFGILDIKLGCEIILLFGLINKVAGVYGLITIFVGGTFLQYLFYAYSISTLFVSLWALKIIKSENAKPTLLVSHLYTLDSLLLNIAHYGFYSHYWYAIPHDGRRTANSPAQQALIDLAVSRGETTDPTLALDGAVERTRLAGDIWNREKTFAIWVIVFGLVLKTYFILILYSYAAHLKASTYHALPLTSRSKATQIAHPTTISDLQAEIQHPELEVGSSLGESGTKGKMPMVAEDDVQRDHPSDSATIKGQSDANAGGSGEGVKENGVGSSLAQQDEKDMKKGIDDDVDDWNEIAKKGRRKDDADDDDSDWD